MLFYRGFKLFRLYKLSISKLNYSYYLKNNGGRIQDWIAYSRNGKRIIFSRRRQCLDSISNQQKENSGCFTDSYVCLLTHGTQHLSFLPYLRPLESPIYHRNSHRTRHGIFLIIVHHTFTFFIPLFAKSWKEKCDYIGFHSFRTVVLLIQFTRQSSQSNYLRGTLMPSKIHPRNSRRHSCQLFLCAHPHYLHRE